MVHLVYCDNKEKVLEKILDGSKTMIVRGAAREKFRTAEFLMMKYCIL